MNRVSIGIRLAMAFSFVVSILIVVGWLGLNRMARINADLNDINYRRWSKLQLAEEALTYSNLNDRLLEGAILSGRQEEVTSLLDQRERNVTRITDIVQTLNGGIEFLVFAGLDRSDIERSVAPRRELGVVMHHERGASFLSGHVETLFFAAHED